MMILDVESGSISRFKHRGNFMPQKTLLNRVGQKIGKLTVLSRAENQIEGEAIRGRWLCRCDCGNNIFVTSHSLGKALLGKGGTRSCGCLVGKAIKHGKSETSIYMVWRLMKQRCGNPKNSAYKSYGGRGISVCKEWEDFPTFFKDMGSAPIGYSLDRIDNSRGYSKENCRWATKLEQGNNRRTNRFFEFNGKNLTLAQWARETGLSVFCIRNRIGSGWSIEKTLSTPSKSYKLQNLH